VNVAEQQPHALDETLDPSAWDSLARQAGETPKAHAAFLDYVRMGPGRSLRKLHERYCQQSDNEPATESPPTQRLRTLADWSVRFAWQKRLAAYKDERDRHDQERWEARRRAVRERDWDAGEELRDLAAKVLAQAPQFVKTTRRLLRGHDGAPDREVITLGLDADALLKTLKLASELQRQAAEVPPPKQQHDVHLTNPIPIAFVRAKGGSKPDASRDATATD